MPRFSHHTHSIRFMSDLYPSFPYDEKELQHINSLISKIPLYKEKIRDLEQDVKRLSREMYKAGASSNRYELEMMIYKAFYLEMENREYEIPEYRLIPSLKAEIAHYQHVKHRNLGCEICGENRSIDCCHIIPNNIGGSATAPNTFYLCPTHHRLFDRFKLTRQEWSKINWERKARFSREWALRETLRFQEEFWNEFPSLDENHVPYPEREGFLPFFGQELLDQLEFGALTPTDSIYHHFGDDLQQMTKQMLICLSENKVLQFNSKDIILIEEQPTITKEILDSYSYH